MVTRSDLIKGLGELQSDPGDIIDLERRDPRYAWRFISPAEALGLSGATGADPDAWIYSMTPWPPDDPGRASALAEDLAAEDLAAEMESMSGGPAGEDRCRWPLDGPWSHRH